MDYIWDFADSSARAEAHLGSRGRMLSDLSGRGLPVPPGFVLSDVACRRFLEVGEFPDGMWEQLEAAVDRLRSRAPQSRPLLLVVRSSPPVPMPGILGRALHVGVNRDTVTHLADWGNPRFGSSVRIDFLRGLAAMRKVPRHRIDAILAAVGPDRRSAPLVDIADGLESLVIEESQRGIPADLLDQLREGIEGVFASWDATPARSYRRSRGLDDDLGTSAVVHLMVFGSTGEDSGVGVAFSRNPETGAPSPTGVFEPGRNRPESQLHYPGLAPLAERHPAVHEEVLQILTDLEAESGDMVRLDFVCERGKLWVLEARSGERSARAAVQIAVDLAAAGTITRQEALMRVDPDALEEMLHDQLTVTAETPVPLTTGVGASPGAASGEVVFDAEQALAATAAGRKVILVRRETTPEDLAGVIAAGGVLTSQGGPTSHTAVAARGTGTPAVTASDVSVFGDRGRVRIGAVTLRAGDEITIDGSTGNVYRGGLDIDRALASEALVTLLGWADAVRTLQVWANADTPEAAERARRMGAEGIGLARTEYMFSGARLDVIRRIILSHDPKDRTRALEELEDLQIGDFERLLESMDGLPVVVRLLDPPLHEFLPDYSDVDHALQQSIDRHTDDVTELTTLRDAVAQWAESNPMLGLRGVRLAVVIPEIYRVQVLSALEAVRRRLDAGGDPRLELMIPLVGAVEEVHLIRDMIDEEVHYAGRQLEITVGTMIELPRAALVAAEIALDSDFFSFGTNDLTQTTLGISRDDAEEAFLRTYLEQGIMRRNPFATIDRPGVGRLIEMAISAARLANPGLTVGVCGEHGGDPESIDFFHEVGVDYVSCSPPRIPVARLAAAQAALRHPAANGPTPPVRGTARD